MQEVQPRCMCGKRAALGASEREKGIMERDDKTV